MSEPDEIKKKFTPAYAEYQKYLQEVVFADEIKKLEERKKTNEIQAVLQREPDKK